MSNYKKHNESILELVKVSQENVFLTNRNHKMHDFPLFNLFPKVKCRDGINHIDEGINNKPKIN